MAITKIIAIRDRLDKRVNYAVNGEKTTLDAGITYATSPEKTEQHFFTSALNCESCETAYAEMQVTKRRFGKLGGVVGYHFIQSFAPGEVTPEQAHAIGVVFARRLFGDRYEVVIGTHLDKAHLHNHVVVNSVSFVDGKNTTVAPAAIILMCGACQMPCAGRMTCPLSRRRGKGSTTPNGRQSRKVSPPSAASFAQTLTASSESRIPTRHY